MVASISDLKPSELFNPLYSTERKRYVMLLDRFEQYSVKPHADALKDHERELDRVIIIFFFPDGSRNCAVVQLKQRKDRRNLLQQRMEACRVLQQVRVDLVDLGRIKQQGLCPEDIEYFDAHGERLRVQLLRSVASILEKHPEVKRPTQEQEGWSKQNS